MSPIQTVLPESDTNTSTSSQPQTSNKPNDDFVIDQLSDHFKGELPSFVANTEKAFEITSDRVVLESPQQHEPEQRP